MEAFTVRQYARDMDIPEGTAWNAVVRGVRNGVFIKADKIKVNGRFYQRYSFAGEEQPKVFVMPKSSFWNDPFNKTGRK